MIKQLIRMMFLTAVIGTSAMTFNNQILTDSVNKMNEDSLKLSYDQQLNIDLEMINALIFLISILSTGLTIILLNRVVNEVRRIINDKLIFDTQINYRYYYA